MNDECLICNAPLEYLETDILMECVICRKKEYSKTKCLNGHYVCDECHTKGLYDIFSLCLNTKSKNPFEILENMMSMDFCHMHGPEHHIMVGASLLTAYKNAGGKLELENTLEEIFRRGKGVPGGVCGFWGACGAGISTGMYISIVTGSTPLTEKAWGLSNQMTAKALDSIGRNGGPRCCKRDSYLAVTAAIEFTKVNLDVEMEHHNVVCSRSDKNNQCIKYKCPFYKEKK